MKQTIIRLTMPQCGECSVCGKSADYLAFYDRELTALPGKGLLCADCVELVPFVQAVMNHCGLTRCCGGTA